MNTDYKIWKKARRNITAKLVLYFLMNCLFVLGTSALLSLDFLKAYETAVRPQFLYVSMAEIFVWLVLFLALSLGKGWVRWLYWVVYALELAALYVPLRLMGTDPGHVLVFLAWIFCMFIQLAIQLQMGLDLWRGRSARIFYDHVLEVYDDEPVLTEEIQPLPQRETKAEEEEMTEEEETIEPAPLTWPQVSFRLGLCVYGELILFPMIPQIFQGYFSSFNMQSVFATRDMFLICIFSAFIWTIPVFFLYYSQKSSKKVIWGSLALEACFALWSGSRLLEYYQSGLYPDRVFILFVALNIIRYALIGMVIAPVLKGEAVPGSVDEEEF